MSFLHDLRALAIQASARYTLRYGDGLYFSGTELPAPSTVKIATRHGPVRCDVYRPVSPVTDHSPTYVHFHGGAFLMRYPAMDDFFARLVVAEVGATVVNVDYDVAPQKRFPVAQEQCHDVGAWISVHGSEIGLDQDRIAVGGFSAGGNLAASAALQARDLGSFEPACQLLAVPSLDVAEDPALKTSPLTSPMIGPGLLNLVRRTYFRDVDARRSPYASPLRATSLEGVAPAVVITGEYDVLRAEGDAYAARLAQDGVDVVHEVVPGADHYFLETGRARARTTLDLVVAQLRRHLGVTAWQSD